jgi:hypothetical protein
MFKKNNGYTSQLKPVNHHQAELHEYKKKVYFTTVFQTQSG